MLEEVTRGAQTAESDCGCAPTAGEKAALWPSMFSRRSALAFGLFGAAAVGVAGAPRLPAAYAADYPSWDDVQRAKHNESAKKHEIGRIEGLIAQLKANAAAAQRLAEKRGDEFYDAQQEFFAANQRADALQKQADEQGEKAKDAANKAGQVAAQLYRSGGDDTALQLFLSDSAASADDLLARLGTMDTLLQANHSVYADAVAARDSAQSLTDQAKDQRKERDRLQKVAEKKMKQAQEASDAAQAAVDAQDKHLDDLEGQLAALKDTTVKTVKQYKAGVEARRKAEEERKRRAAAAAKKAAEEARKRAAEEAARRAAEEKKNHNSGGGGSPAPSGGGSSGGSAGSGGSGGWVRPSAGHQSSGYGQRYVQCGHGYCASSFHEGVDLAPGCGAHIVAAHSGRVTYAGYNGGYGNYIRIDHGGGIGSGYGHIRPGGIVVRSGQHVQAGQLIAYVGNTGNSFGCHLHYEVYVNGRPTNPIPFMARYGISV